MLVNLQDIEILVILCLFQINSPNPPAVSAKDEANKNILMQYLQTNWFSFASFLSVHKKRKTSFSRELNDAVCWPVPPKSPVLHTAVRWGQQASQRPAIHQNYCLPTPILTTNLVPTNKVGSQWVLLASLTHRTHCPHYLNISMIFLSDTMLTKLVTICVLTCN